MVLKPFRRWSVEERSEVYGFGSSVMSSDAVSYLPPPQHAYALELLHDQLYEGAKALDVGSGSGILSVCFARMVSPRKTGKNNQLGSVGAMLRRP